MGIILNQYYKSKSFWIVCYFYYFMYNDQFQYGQRISTSGYGSDSLPKPSPFRPEQQPRPSQDLPPTSQANTAIIQKI